MRRTIILLLLTTLVIGTSGCALHFYKKNPKARAEIEKLESEVERLTRLRAEEKDEFKDIQRALIKKLKGQEVALGMQSKGLVITLANNILFDSGRAKIKQNAYQVLDKIADVIKTKAAEKNIGIEGHTDNVPIKYSGWKSNRELSTARANNVYHYLMKKGVRPARLTTMGYGEFQPVASNNSEKGRAKNRRVEIVILPQYQKKGAVEIEAAKKAEVLSKMEAAEEAEGTSEAGDETWIK